MFWVNTSVSIVIFTSLFPSTIIGFPSASLFSSKITFVIKKQSLKALVLIVVTEPGIVIEVSLVFAKACPLITCKLRGKVMLVIPVAWKAVDPISVILSDNTISVKVETPLQKPAGILV